MSAIWKIATHPIVCECCPKIILKGQQWRYMPDDKIACESCGGYCGEA